MKKTKKILTNLLISTIVFSSALSFNACNFSFSKDNDELIEQPAAPSDDPVPPISPTEPIEPDQPVIPPIVEVPTTLSKFMIHNRDAALAFAQQFKSVLCENKDILSESYSFSANDDGEITEISMNYTYAEDEYMRINEVARISFDQPIAIDDILDENLEKYDLSADTLKTKRGQVEVFHYDAKQNYVKEDLNEVLKLAADVTSENTLFKEVVSEDEEKQKFELAVIDEKNNTQIYTIEVDKAENKDELIANLKDETKTAVALTGSVIFSKYDYDRISVFAYEKEKFLPENIDDLLENYTDYVHRALNESMYEKIAKKCYGTRLFDETKLVDAEWRIINSDQTTITGFKFISTYAISVPSPQYTVGSIELAEPVNVVDFVDENSSTIFATAAANATMKNEYSFGYTIGENEERKDLINAIFEAKGMGLEKPEGSVRYISEFGAVLHDTLGEARQFTVTQIENNKITQFTIYIKHTSSDEEYIQQLKDESNYIIDLESTTLTPGYYLDYKVLESEMELVS
ncbi:MAG: hypothetical protein IJ506_06425 [Clostridia bacterium]|nr:hypothetical protein [Clostridia bacterium]